MAPSPDSLLRSAAAALAANQIEKAEAAYKTLMERHPSHPAGPLGYGILVCATGRYAEAVNALRRAVKAAESSPLAHHHLGVAQLGLRDHASAAKSFQRAVELDPGNLDAWTNLGVCLGYVGDHVAAASALRRVTQAQPDNALAHFNLGNALRSVGDPAGAVKAYHASLSLDRTFAGAWCNLGAARADQALTAEAESAYRQAIALDPNLTPAWLGLASAQWENGDGEAAAASYRKASDLNPDSAKLWSQLGDAMSDLERLDEATEAYEHALRLVPDLHEALRGLGIIHRKKFQPQAAVEILTEAASKHPDRAEIHYELGQAYYEGGHNEHAIESFRRVLALAPDHVEALLRLSDLLEAAYKFEEADSLRRSALTRRPFVVQPFNGGAVTTPRLLLISSGGIGNLPTRYLIPLLRYRQTLVYPAYLSTEDYARLPPFDLCFNLIGDPDVAGPDLDAADRFRAAIDKPFLNLPDCVRRTTRERTPTLLGDIPGLIAPVTIKLDRAALHAPDLEDRLAQAGLAAPLLFRPAGSHGGKDLRKIDDLRELATIDLPYDTYFLTQFVDYRSEDGRYRKYRFLLIDGEPYPLHLAISKRWMIHYFNSEMTEHAWMRREEESFFEEFSGAGPMRARAALKEIARRIGLDYVGVDCGVNPDGSLVLFEANANMLLRLDDDPALFPYKHRHIPKVVEAFETMLRRRAAEAGA